MSNAAYQRKLADPRWQKKRLKIMERDNFTCKTCSDDKTEIHVHHKKYVKEPWDAPDEFLETLCSHCHNIITHLKYNYKKILKYRERIDQTTPSYCICLDEDGTIDLVSFNVNGSLKKVEATFFKNSILLKDMYELMFQKNG